jgi:adenylosuccinate synthase
MNIEHVDICCGLAWGDEGKGKLVVELLKKNKYDLVCRWSGGSNAGHTVYINNKKYVTHIIPSGVFFGILSYIGPDCYINIDDFESEINYLKENGFDTSLIKISPRTHLITKEHKEEDLKKYKEKQGTTGKGIAPCSRDKFARIGKMVGEDLQWLEKYRGYILNDNENSEILKGKILCEGAQGFWLDINYGNYPYITSSYTLPYSACSLGFPPQKLRNIYGACKIYDTRVGVDPDFPDSLLENEVLNKIAIVGNELGSTTGRRRKVNWLDLDKLVRAINISGTTHVIISKVDILEKVESYSLILNEKILNFTDITGIKNEINKVLNEKCKLLKNIIYSDSPESIDGL